MSRRLFAPALAALVLLGGVAPLCAEQFGTAEEARAMLERAIAALKANEAAALKEFNDVNNKQYHDRDLYIFCFGVADGNFTAYPSAMLLGTNVRDLKLPDDPSLGQRAYDAIVNAAEGSVVTMEYNLPKPGTKKPVPKQSVEARVGNQGCGVSYYK